MNRLLLRQTFAGRVAIVTGASSGIGAATAKRLAGEGAAVFGTGRSEQGLAQTEKAIVEAGGIFQLTRVEARNCLMGTGL